MSPPLGRERRRFPRYDAAVPAIVRKRGGSSTLVAVDVSRHGAFLRAEGNDTELPPVRQLLQLRFAPPGTPLDVDLDVMCMVARTIPAGDPSGRGPGIGVDFFSLSKEAKAHWERFIAALKVQPMEIRPGGDVNPRVWIQPTRHTGDLPPAGEANRTQQPQREAGKGVVFLRFATREAVEAFARTELPKGTLFLRTPLLKDVGENVEVVVVHPETDDEFRLEGTVVGRVVGSPADASGLHILLRAVTASTAQDLAAFAETGVEVVAVGTPISAQLLALEQAVEREPDTAEALEALGAYLLEHDNDLGGALTALTRALVLMPSMVSIHASLARAYRQIGDASRVRAHERVAAALLTLQEELRHHLDATSE